MKRRIDLRVPGQLLLAAAAGLLLVACAQAPHTDSAPTTGAPPPQPSPSRAELVATMEQHALRDLSARLQVAPAEIEMLDVETVTWSDGALGCPQPGFAYTQALVSGFRLILASDGREYHYHAGSHGRPFLCPEDRRHPPLRNDQATEQR